MADLLKRCRRYLSIDSRNSSGTRSFAECVARDLKGLGFEIAWQPYPWPWRHQVNLIARLGPSEGRPLILHTHLDTVETEASAWTETGRDPWAAAIKQGRLYGLGAADTKLALAAQCEALAGIDVRRLRRPLFITGSYGEEIGMLGIHGLLADRRLRRGDVINSEPTELKPSHGHYGYRIYRMSLLEWRGMAVAGYCHRIRFAGRAAHSAVAKHGRNAVAQALRWWRQQSDYPVLLDLFGGTAPNILAATCELTVISHRKILPYLKRYGGEIIATETVQQAIIYPGINHLLHQMPESWWSLHTNRESTNIGRLALRPASLEMDVSHRFAPGVSPERHWKMWQKRLRKLARTGTAISLTLTKENPAYQLSGRHPWLRQVQGVLRRQQRSAAAFIKPGCTEAAYWARQGSHVVTLGPGQAYGNAHQPNESIRMQELTRAVRFYRNLIMEGCF